MHVNDVAALVSAAAAVDDDDDDDVICWFLEAGDCSLTMVVPRPTQPFIPRGPVNEDQLRLGR